MMRCRPAMSRTGTSRESYAWRWKIDRFRCNVHEPLQQLAVAVTVTWSNRPR
jgi:hypothetical protein